nr:MAG TPA: 3-hydroxyisobutyryl-CoA hydrolase [Caudoviricetes sp.]
MTHERNYARFYTLLKKMPGADKETLVSQYTDGRTTSLRETTRQEYDRMCRDMERETGYDEFVEGIRRQLRCRRSEVLKLMQQLGIDTTDWNRVDAFCKDVRITGKAFRHISIDELEALAVKLRIIERKGGLKARPQQPEQPTTAARLQQTIIVVAAEKAIEN